MRNAKRLEPIPSEWSTEQILNRDRLLTWCTYTVVIWAPLFAALYYWGLGVPAAAGVLMLGAPAFLLSPFLLRLTGSIPLTGNYMALLVFIVLLDIALYTGGLHSPALMWNLIVPIIASLLVGFRSGIFWVAMLVAEALVFYWLRHLGFDIPQMVSQEGVDVLELLSLIGLTIATLSLAWLYELHRRMTRSAVETSSRAKSEFLANMSHEIRTPLTAILGYTDLLKERHRKDASLELLETIHRNGEHLLGIINDILDLSKIEAGRFDVEQHPCSPRRIVSDVVTLMKVRAEEKELRLSSTVDDAVPELISTDPRLLRQILLNLVGNAIKFTPTGQVRLLAATATGDYGQPMLNISVIDTGIGIEHDQLAEIFDPFAQTDESVSRCIEGTGLGLAICRRLAAILGGEITVSSWIGYGSTFTVSIPLIVAEATEKQEAETPQAGPSASAESTALDCRVLLAEDGPDNQRLISFLLKKAGAEVTVAENGEVACRLVSEARAEGTSFDVILMDMQMPVLNGYDATRRLREEGYDGPIVALTADAMRGTEQRCLDAGCNDYATKPIDRPKLIGLVGAYAERAREASAAR